jgi:oligopeptide transport system ATP-binding protein
MLLAAEPAGEKPPPPTGAPVLLEAKDVEVSFKIGGGWFSGPPIVIKAVDGVSLELRVGQTVGVVGESGSGKSTLGRALLRLNHGTGRIRFAGVDISTADRAAMRPHRREMQLVFQDPFGSLSPRMTAGQIVTEGLLVHEPSLSTAQRDRAAGAALAGVGLDPATRNRYPHEFSGGQRQRIAIARVILKNAAILVLDEATSALDSEVEGAIQSSLDELMKNKTVIAIAHRLSTIARMDRLVILDKGRIVEQGTHDELLQADGHYAALWRRQSGGFIDSPDLAAAE